MEYLFLVIFLVAALLLEGLLDHIWWIGGLIILYFIYSIIKQIANIRNGELDFDGGEFAIILLKIASIIITVVVMLFVYC